MKQLLFGGAAEVSPTGTWSFSDPAVAFNRSQALAFANAKQVEKFLLDFFARHNSAAKAVGLPFELFPQSEATVRLQPVATELVYALDQPHHWLSRWRYHINPGDRAYIDGRWVGDSDAWMPILGAELMFRVRRDGKIQRARSDWRPLKSSRSVTQSVVFWGQVPRALAGQGDDDGASNDDGHHHHGSHHGPHRGRKPGQPLPKHMLFVHDSSQEQQEPELRYLLPERHVPVATLAPEYVLQSSTHDHSHANAEQHSHEAALTIPATDETLVAHIVTQHIKRGGKEWVAQVHANVFDRSGLMDLARITAAQLRFHWRSKSFHDPFKVEFHEGLTGPELTGAWTVSLVVEGRNGLIAEDQIIFGTNVSPMSAAGAVA